MALFKNVRTPSDLVKQNQEKVKVPQAPAKVPMQPQTVHSGFHPVEASEEIANPGMPIPLIRKRGCSSCGRKRN